VSNAILDKAAKLDDAECDQVGIDRDPLGMAGGEGALGVDHLREGAGDVVVHDVGKLGVSNAILDKAAKLDDAEWRDMRNHALLSETSAARRSQRRRSGAYPSSAAIRSA
jgi:hypothetical protein